MDYIRRANDRGRANMGWLNSQHSFSYEQKTISSTSTITPLINPTGTLGALSINQDVSVDKLVLKRNGSISLNTGSRWVYLHLIRGTLNTDDLTFSKGDAFGLKQHKCVLLTATDDAEGLWFNLPVGQG